MIKIKIGEIMLKYIHYNVRLSSDKVDIRKKFKELNLDPIVSFIDRYKTIEHYLPVEPYSEPIKSNPNFKKNFEDICNDQAISLLKEGKKINLFWSGGLDSTTALVALLSNCTNRDQISISATYNSIIESGYFYDTFLKPFNINFDLPRTNWSSINKEIVNDNELGISGQGGNNLFTTGAWNIDKIVPEAELLKKPYKDVVVKEKQEFYYPVILKSPKPIITYEDFLWFEGYAFFWDQGRFDKLLKYFKPKNIKEYLKFFRGFYYIKDFEEWSINNNEQQHDIKNFVRTTKLPMRKYILKTLGDKASDYVNNKKVCPSRFETLDNSYKYVTTDFEVHFN
jgi:hypothetical protein